MPKVTRRLTRIFSQTSKRTVGDNEISEECSHHSVTESADQHVTDRLLPSLRRQSRSGKDAEGVNAPDISKEQTDEHQETSQFKLFEDGIHSHYLESTLRPRGWLSGVFRDMLEFTKKEGEPSGQHLTGTLAEKYGRLQEIAGYGSFGIVRVSRKVDQDNKTESLYAVKTFLRRPSDTPKRYQKRIKSEFCISSALHHPNVVHTLDLYEDAEGDFCAVMEFCVGGDLHSVILRSGKLEVLEAACYFKQLMLGVEYLHEMGVAHRDLKVENLLLTAHGCLKIIDFGNAECFRAAWETEARTCAGICGSPPYISPEVYTEREFDARPVDVWSAGIVYMVMRTGKYMWGIAKQNEDDDFKRYLHDRKEEDGFSLIETLHRVRLFHLICYHLT
jgi:protein-serine/threonine kinase